MSATDYQRWLAAGSPWRLSQPLDELARTLRGYGYTVYARGDLSHMTHEPPEDHTPYSATGWPTTALYGVGYAIDIMPPPAGSGAPSLAALGAQLYRDRQAGRIGWLKYINWEPGTPGSPCYHDSWQPDHVRRTSSDRGHLHVSARTGWETRTAAGYDPVAILRGDDMPTASEIARAVWNWDLQNGDGEDPAYRVVNRAAAGVAALAGRAPVDAAAIAAQLLAVLSPEAIAAAIPADLASRVADQLAARLAE